MRGNHFNICICFMGYATMPLLVLCLIVSYNLKKALVQVVLTKFQVWDEILILLWYL